MANKLPKSWRIVNLDDISTPPQYGWTTKSASSGTIKYLRTTDISSKIINWERVPFCVDLPEDLEKFFLQENDIVISRAGSVGLSFIVNEIPYKTIFASYLIRFKPLIVDPYFVYYFLKSSDYWNHISRSSAGIAVQNVNAQKLANLEVPLPPLQEQKRISSSLDKLLQNLNAIQTRLDNFPKFISDFRQQVLHKAVTGQLTKDWRKKNGIKKDLKHVRLIDHSTKIGSGSTPHGGQSAYMQKGIPLIRSMNVHSNGFRYDGLAFINKQQAHDLKNVIVQKDDVLLNITGASIGRVCLAPSDMEGARVNQHVCIIRTRLTISRKYLHFYLASPPMQAYINSENYGVTRQALTKQMIDNFEIPLPNIKEQKEIVKRVNILFKQINKVEKQYESLKNLVDELPQVILAKAFSGKLVPQNPKDEPVEKLLERIKEEKSKLQEQQKELKKNRFAKRIGKRKMKEEKKKDLFEIIKANPKGISPEELLKEANYNLKEVDDFYRCLKSIRHQIDEIKPKDSKNVWPIKSVLLKAKAVK